MPRIVIAIAVLSFGVSLGADEEKPKPLTERAKMALNQLQGQWVAKEFGRNGITEDLKTLELILEIKGDKWIFTGKEKAIIVALDSTSDPKCFDLKSVEEGVKGKVDEGIYQVDGDTLTICLHQGNEKSRPTKFEANSDRPDTILAVFERRKKK